MYEASNDFILTEVIINSPSCSSNYMTEKSPHDISERGHIANYLEAYHQQIILMAVAHPHTGKYILYTGPPAPITGSPAPIAMNPSER